MSPDGTGGLAGFMMGRDAIRKAGGKAPSRSKSPDIGDATSAAANKLKAKGALAKGANRFSSQNKLTKRGGKTLAKKK